MRIEMTGPPTAGKSRLVRELVKQGVPKGVVGEIKNIPKEWEPFAGTVRKIYNGTSYKSLPDKTLRAIAAAYVGDKHKGLMVYDELLILVGFSLAIRMPEFAMKYFNKVPLPGALIMLNADWETIKARNEERGDRSRPDKSKRCIRSHKIYLPVLENRGCRIMRFNTANLGAEKIAKLILRKLR